MLTSILAGLCLLFTMDINYSLDREIACREVVEIEVQSKSGKKVWRNKKDIRAVDVSGKMLFHLNVERVGKRIMMVCTPVKKKLFAANTELTMKFSNGDNLILSSISTQDHVLRIPLNAEKLESIRDQHILQLEFGCAATDYNVLLRSDQSFDLSDALDCINL